MKLLQRLVNQSRFHDFHREHRLFGVSDQFDLVAKELILRRIVRVFIIILNEYHFAEVWAVFVFGFDYVVLKDVHYDAFAGLKIKEIESPLPLVLLDILVLEP